jgi:hypothetical protein
MLAAAVLLAAGSTASAQSHDPIADGDRPPLGGTITVDALGTLPSGASIYALLDTAIPDVTSDRMETGGLTTGDAARVGAHGSTWTQTTFRVADMDITDPGTSGTPLLVPGVSEWDRVEVATGMMPAEVSAPGMSVGLVPRQASRRIGWLDAFGSPPGLNADGAADKPPPLTRLDTWAHGNLVAGAPIGDRHAALVSASWTRASFFERTNPTSLDASLASLFFNVMTRAPDRDRVRLVGWLQRARSPLEHHAAFGQPTAADRRLALHGQAAWERAFTDGGTLRAFGGVTLRGRSAEMSPAPFIVIERLADGPVQTLLDPGEGTDRLIEGGLRWSRAVDGGRRHHELSAGADWTRSFSSQQAAFTGRVGELVNGIPARAWEWTDPAAESQWHADTITAFASDTVAVNPRLTLNGSLRFESIRGYSTDDAAGAVVSWNDVYPRAGLHVALTDFWHIGTFVQYSRYGHRLPLRDLAYGDATAPTGSIYRWRGGNLALPASLGPLIQRIGPGTGGRADFTGIDPALTRPSMHEMVFGFESRPHPAAFVRMAAVARREATLIGVVDVGVPESTYARIQVPDTAIDRIGSQDDQLLTFYNRAPSSFGADRYLLTNPSDNVATFVGVDFVGEVHARRLFLIAGGTAGRSEGLSGNRGFGPLENDPGVLGEVFVDPNARVYAQGRFFTERGYTIKTAISYQFDHDLTAGLVGRYQDGQHFARLVVLDSLNQGAEAVRAFRNGRTRFTFTMTVDGRVQKGFAVGGRRFALTFDAYNIFNQALSVEELQVTGAGARKETAVQPPRALHVGLRIPF